MPKLTESWDDAYRGSGRTTSIILSTVRDAIWNPNTVVSCKDHYDRLPAHSHVFKKVHDILTLLNVDHDANSANLTIRVHPIKKVKE